MHDVAFLCRWTGLDAQVCLPEFNYYKEIVNELRMLERQAHVLANARRAWKRPLSLGAPVFGGQIEWIWRKRLWTGCYFRRVRAAGLLGGGGAAGSTLGAYRLARCGGALCGGAPRRGAARLPGERLARNRVARFALERFGHGARYAGPPFRLAPALTRLIGVFRALPCSLGCLAALWRRQVDAGATRFGQPDGDRLFGRARAMLAMTNFVDFLVDEFARLGRGRFAFALDPGAPYR